MNLGMKKLSIT